MMFQFLDHLPLKDSACQKSLNRISTIPPAPSIEKHVHSEFVRSSFSCSYLQDLFSGLFTRSPYILFSCYLSQLSVSWSQERKLLTQVWAEVGKAPDFLWNKQVEPLFPWDGSKSESVLGLGSHPCWAELMQGRGRTPVLFLDTLSCWKAAGLHNGRGGISFTISWVVFFFLSLFKTLL